MCLKSKIFVKKYFKKLINTQKYEKYFEFSFFFVFLVFSEFFKDFFSQKL